MARPQALWLSPACFAVASVLFVVALQTSLTIRKLLWPLILANAVLSIQKSSDLHVIDNVADLWSLMICIWTQHAFCVLFLSPVRFPAQATTHKQRLVHIYKIWNGTRYRYQSGCMGPNEEEDALASKGRMTFFFRQLSIFWLLGLTRRNLIRPLHAKLPFMPLTGSDFAPSRRTFLRRMLLQWLSFASAISPSVTVRETQIRLYICLYWIYTSYLRLTQYHILLSLLFVCVLRLDKPDEWQPLYGSPRFALRGIRAFWSRFWHSLGTNAWKDSAQAIVRYTLGWTPDMRATKLFVAFWSFLVSGVFHAIASYETRSSNTPWHVVLFYLVNFGAGLMECVVEQSMHAFLQAHPYHLISRIVQSRRVRRISEAIWVISFFGLILPKFQYEDLYHTVKRMEEIQWVERIAMEFPAEIKTSHRCGY